MGGTGGGSAPSATVFNPPRRAEEDRQEGRAGRRSEGRCAMMHLRQPLQLPKGGELRALIHARFSTEEQRQSSIDGQIAACRYPGGSSWASIFLSVCQPTPYLAIAARLLKAPVSTSRRTSLQISMSQCTPVPLSERGCDRGCRPDPPRPKNCTVVRRHFGPPRHGPRAAVFDRRQHATPPDSLRPLRRRARRVEQACRFSPLLSRRDPLGHLPRIDFVRAYKSTPVSAQAVALGGNPLKKGTRMASEEGDGRGGNRRVDISEAAQARAEG